MFGLFLLVSLGLGGNESGETITSQQSTGLQPGNAGPVSDAVPPLLASLFKDVGGQVGVPAALLAAISNQECNQLWDAARSNPETIQGWITSNTDVDNRGCGFDNGFRVWGPMQFQDTTFGLSRGADPRTHPQPTAGSFGDKAGKLTGHTPASMLNIKDAVTAAALKLLVDSGKTAGETWQERHITKAAARYFGACDATYTDRRSGRVITVHYCTDILAKYRRYGGQLGD